MDLRERIVAVVETGGLSCQRATAQFEVGISTAIRWVERFVIIATAFISTPVQAQSSDNSFNVYTVNVVKTKPFQNPFTGYGIYLGKGAVITAFHVIGHWGFLKKPHVLIAGQNLPARIVKEGSREIDLTLLSVDEARLPVSLRMRRNPLCQQPPRAGEKVIVVAPGQMMRSHIISPLLIHQALRKTYGTLINEVAGSGSGVFDAARGCLLGIISRRIKKYDYREQDGEIVVDSDGYAGYFVPASQIANFIPAEFRF